MKSAASITNPIGDRLKFEMKKRGVTSAELAKRADVKTSFIYDVISGKSANPSTVKLARVAEGLGVNLATLVESHAADGQFKKNTYIAVSDYVLIPRITVEGSLADGEGMEEEPYSFRKSWIREHLGVYPDDLRMLNISGDCMEPNLCHNDMVLIDTTKTVPTPPGIFVLFEGYGLVAKRVEYLTQNRVPRVRVLSDNPQYSVYERALADITIIGRVVWFAREI